MHNRVINAICIDMMIKNGSARTDQYVAADKSVQFRVVISAHDPIHPSLFIVDIPSIAERIQTAKSICHSTSLAQAGTPCVVLIFYNDRAGTVNDTDNVPLKVVEVGIDRTVVEYTGEQDGDFLRVSYEGKAGYVHGEYLENVEDTAPVSLS